MNEDEWVTDEDWVTEPAKPSVKDRFSSILSGIRGVAENPLKMIDEADRFIQGVKKIPQGAGQLIYNTSLEYGKKNIDTIANEAYGKTNGWLGYDEKTYNDYIREHVNTKGFDPLEFAGTAVASAPIAIASAPGFVGGAVAGAANALLDPVGEENYWKGKGVQVGTGAGLGGLIGAAGKGLSNLLAPGMERTPQAEALIKEGIRPTVGQQFGGNLDIAERKLVGAPFVGDAVSKARNKAIEEFNVATTNKAMAPLGEGSNASGPFRVVTSGNIGHEGFDKAMTKVDAAYGKSLGGITALDLNSDQAQQGIAEILAKYSWDLSEETSNKLNRQLMSYADVLGKGGTDGKTVKSVISDINDKLLKYNTSHNAENQFMGEALSDFKSIINNQIANQYPESAKLLNQTDEAFKRMTRIGRAVNKGPEGVFDTKELLGSIKELDKSSGKRAFARGKALMQDWADTGRSSLGTRINQDNAGRYGLLHLLMNPKAIMNLPSSIALGASAAAESDAARDALSQFLMKKESPFSDMVRKYGLSALGGITSEQGS